MAQVWVKGYTKKDGTKVKGYYKGNNTPFQKVRKRDVRDSMTKKLISTTWVPGYKHTDGTWIPGHTKGIYK